jgi:cytochrome c biogenesis protein CcmG/thiol:disulfide interchange protein DsbE
MKNAWKFVVPLLLFGGLFALFYVSLDRDKQTLPSPLIGKPAPSLSLPGLNDPETKFTNSDYAGKPWVLNVWGTWCPGCLHEHSTLLQIAERNEVPMVGMDWRDDAARAALYLKKKGNPYTFSGMDPEGSLAIDWGVYAAPETFLIGADGKVLYKLAGPMTMEIWEKEFLTRLRSRGTSE